MDEHKCIIKKFLDDVEIADGNCDLDSLNDREIYLLMLIRACRNKLIDVYNCIGNDGWAMPDFEMSGKCFMFPEEIR